MDLRPKIFAQFPEIKTDFAVRPMDSECTLTQEHGNAIVYVSEAPDAPLPGDGAFTDKTNTELTIRSADCLPILFYNPAVKVIGVVHAGWRGTEKEIIKAAVNAVVEKFNAQAQDFYFYFGPAAQVCHYERPFVEDNVKQLLSLGIPADHIENSGICTIQNLEYPSHRREQSARKDALFSSISRVK